VVTLFLCRELLETEIGDASLHAVYTLQVVKMPYKESDHLPIQEQITEVVEAVQLLLKCISKWLECSEVHPAQIIAASGVQRTS